MMKQAKALGRKDWNKGWRHRDRAKLNRGIEKSFRQAGRRDVEERAREAVPAPGA